MVSGESKGRKEADSKYTMSKKASSTSLVKSRVGKTYQSKGNFTKDLKNKLRPGRGSKSAAGLVAGAAAGGYASHKVNESIQKPFAAKRRENSNDRLMAKINKANKQ